MSYPLAMDLAFITRRLDAYERLIRLDKPIGTLLLLWPTLWAVWLAARGLPDLDIVLIFVRRHAADALGRLRDQRLRRPRLRSRTSSARATGRSPPARSGRARRCVVAALLAAAAFGLVLFLNALAIALSFVALAIAVSYPFAKRFFALPQAWLGVAFGFGIPMAYAAIQWRLPLECWVAVRRQRLLCRSPTTPSTRWSTATTTRGSACAPRRSRSAAGTSPR